MAFKIWFRIFFLGLAGAFLAGWLVQTSADVAATSLASLQAAPSPASPLKPLVVPPLKHDLSPELRQIPLPAQPFQPAPKEINLGLPKARTGLLENPDQSAPALQPELLTTGLMPEPVLSMDSLPNLFGGWPPDTQGDIGPNHYVQWINLHLAVWELDKVDATARLIFGPVPGNSLFQGFGGPCETTNDGDPITLYDPLADRWLMSQFALPNYPYGPFYQCVAVSQTNNPTGAWYRYAYQIPVDKMNDYPKFGVWPNAYFMTVNQYQAGTLLYGGAGVAALDRAALLAGQPADMVYFDLFTVNSDFGGILPADMDGLLPPPAGSPGIFVEWDDATWIGPVDAVRLWEFHVDWANPGISTFGLSGHPNQVIPTANVDPDLCAYSRECIPQPGTTRKLDAISDRLMYRLQYRNFGNYETLVTNHTVDVNGLDHAGIHWFELRRDSSTWVLHQEGAYAPDIDHRWMGSAALDHMGNLALGYSVSGFLTFPSVRYAGRLLDDPVGTLPLGEQSLVEGGGAQTGSSRWGDYSMLGVDPMDDCTFWYTQEYVEVGGSNTWKTRIGSFRFPNCSIGPQGILQGKVTDSGTSQGLGGATVQAWQAESDSVSTLTAQDGSYSLHLPVGMYEVSASAYGYFPEIYSGLSIFTSTITLQDFSLEPAPYRSLTGVVRDRRTGWPLYARITLPGLPVPETWSNALTGEYQLSLPEGSAYTLQVDAFSAGYASLQAVIGPLRDDLSQDLLVDVDLAACSAPGYHRVTVPLYASDFEMNSGGFALSGTSSWAWGSPTSGPGVAYSGTHVWATNLSGDYSLGENGFLVSPAINVSAYPGYSPVLRWQQWLQTEPDYDNASLQLSTDGGLTWTTLYGPVSGDVDLAWAQHELALDPSTAVENLRLRFSLATDGQISFPGWYIDDVWLGVQDCVPMPGGLLSGFVYDENTSSGLIGALIGDDLGNKSYSQGTPLDDQAPDGYYSMFLPSGTRLVTAEHPGGYLAEPVSIQALDGDFLLNDFYLSAGWLEYQPAALEFSLELGMTQTLPVQLSNLGQAPADFTLVELTPADLPVGLFDMPEFVVKPFKQSSPSSAGLGIPDQPLAPRLAGGEVLAAFTPEGSSPIWSVAFDSQLQRLWLSSPSPAWGGDDHLYQYTLPGEPTGTAYLHEPEHMYGPADLAYNWHTGKIWSMYINNGIANCIYEIDPAAGYTGRAICPETSTGFAVSQRGLAYDPVTDTWFAGGWNDLMIYRFDSTGKLLNSSYTGLAISGLAYNPGTHHLFAMVNADPTRVYVLDTAADYAVLGSITIAQGFPAFTGAGLEIDCSGNLWAVDQGSRIVYQFTSGETTQLCALDIPWIAEEPDQGALPALSDQTIAVTVDAGLPAIDQPGIYSSWLKTVQDTPYLVADIPVTMTVTPPPDYGLLTGTVYGLGYCDQDPQPLPGAQVEILSSLGETWQLTSDALGTYQRWLDSQSGPFTVTASALEHLPLIVSGIDLSGGSEERLDLNLNWEQPCLSFQPLEIVSDVNAGGVAEIPVLLENRGYAPASFEFLELPGSFTPASASPTQISATLLDEGFESGVVPPGGWSLVSSSPLTWSLSGVSPHTGSFSAHVSFGFNQDEWLLSPVLDAKEAVLSFWSYGSLYWCRDTYDACDLNIWIVTGEPGGGDDIFIGQGDTAWQSSFTWAQTEFNLGANIPDQAYRIGFQYLGNDGAEIALDDILLNGLPISDVTWLSAEPAAGSLLPVTGTQVVTARLDSSLPDTLLPGAYTASFLISSNDPTHPYQMLPVTMNVLPAEYGVSISGDQLQQDIPGQVVTYAVTVTNTSTSLQDTLLLSLEGQTWLTQLSTLQTGLLAPGEAETVEVRVYIPEQADAGASDTATVKVVSLGDPSKLAYTHLTTTALLPQADVEVIKLGPLQPVPQEAPITYTIVVTNHGPTRAAAVTLLDVMPENLAYLSDSAGCALTGNVLVCELGTMAALEKRSIILWAVPRWVGELVNQAVAVVEDDPDLTNNWSYAAIQVFWQLFIPWVVSGPSG